MTFKNWLKLKESGTSTADVAGFSRPTIGGPVRRNWLGPWADEDPFFKKKKQCNKCKDIS